MKSFGKCRGCERRKLVNLMRLCKKCNKEAHKFISKEEMESILKEHAVLAKEKADTKKAKADEDAAKEEEASEEEGNESPEAEA